MERELSFFDFFNSAQPESLWHQLWEVSLSPFAPELILAATILVMLIVRLPRFGRRVNASYLALAGSIVALAFVAPWRELGEQWAAGDLRPIESVEIFQGMLVYDGMSVFFRALLIFFAILFAIFTWLSGIPDREDGPDFYTLVLGATIGMCLMVSANHMLMVFLAVEMASVPSYVLAGMLKGRRQSSEAALKYSVYGAGTAGVMLYGISLLSGSLGSVHIPTMAAQLSTLPMEAYEVRQIALVMGGLMLMVGLAFKLSAVPFHFWCPDVFEGASAEIGAFLSVASKAAALALLVRIAFGFGHAPPVEQPVDSTIALASYVQAEAPEAEAAAAEAGEEAAAAEEDESLSIMQAARRYIVGVIGLFAVITCTFGNLAAYAQTNIKRLLAYSTIAHAGYMMMPVAAAVKLIDGRPDLANDAIAALGFYAAVYLFMNLGAFAIVAFLRNEMRSEEIADYAGLIRRTPGMVICLGIILVSLLGLPPLSGFAAKFAIFLPLIQANLGWLFVIGVLNTVISLIYYIRVIKVMTLDPEPEDRLPVEFSMASAAGVYVLAITVPVVLLGVWWVFMPWAGLATQNLIQ